LWRWLAEKNLVKGDKIYLEGRLRTRSWDDENGQKRYTTEIQGDKVLKLSSTGSQPYSSESAAQDIDQNTSTNETTKTDNGTMEEDDLPF
jgi:single-strand DNA-binding protein